MFKGYCVECGKNISEKCFELRGNYCSDCNNAFRLFGENKITSKEVKDILDKIKIQRLSA